MDRDWNATNTSTVDEIQTVSEKQLSPGTNELNDINTMTHWNATNTSTVDEIQTVSEKQREPCISVCQCV